MTSSDRIDPVDSPAAKSKKPTDSAFKQQRLPAWQPILTAGTVLPTFFVIGIAFIPIGIGMLWFSETVVEKEIHYTECEASEWQNGINATWETPDSVKKCHELVNHPNNQTCKCKPDWGEITFKLDKAMEGSVFIYYGLTNFYQNHRRYVKSRDDGQLKGDVNKNIEGTDCDPFDVDPDGKKYIPCGAIANSLFSDSITMNYTDKNKKSEMVKLTKTGIAWQSDKDYKFKNPEGNLEEEINKANGVKPRDWHKELWELDTGNKDNNGLQNEDLIVWMRTAALPNFRKLYRKVDHSKDPFKNGLPAGTYTLDIEYRFRVKQFSGTKSVIISTTSLLGGQNPFLGIAYITVGSICLLMGVVFLFIHIKCGKQTSEMLNINSRTPYNDN